MGWLGQSLCGDSHVGWRGVREGLVASLTLLVGAWDKKGFQLNPWATQRSSKPPSLAMINTPAKQVFIRVPDPGIKG